MTTESMALVCINRSADVFPGSPAPLQESASVFAVSMTERRVSATRDHGNHAFRLL